MRIRSPRTLMFEKKSGRLWFGISFRFGNGTERKPEVKAIQFKCKFFCQSTRWHSFSFLFSIVIQLCWKNLSFIECLINVINEFLHINFVVLFLSLFPCAWEEKRNTHTWLHCDSTWQWLNSFLSSISLVGQTYKGQKIHTHTQTQWRNANKR